MEYSKYQISNGVSEARMREYVSKTQPEKPLYWKRILTGTAIGALAFVFIIGMIIY